MYKISLEKMKRMVAHLRRQGMNVELYKKPNSLDVLQKEKFNVITPPNG
ncbi:hypothetical protein [Halobacillus amylolyticus]|uniref:Uncharacterized protein n=1 Tax=Halobacillus amylolyticus TaxID=2932259 RepID=A0ABY4HGT6_9BACI|nr:hypothetical protein [Halobacillus amylolyticus]UOR13588.1 hypothetical protein MUO15_09110 [Halobacillus amylolyticus]